MGRCSRIRFARRICGGALAFIVFGVGSARADVGTVQEIQEIDEAVEATLQPSQVTETTVTEALPTTEEEAVNRQWTLSTPGGPTAFVLDAHDFEIGMPLDRLNQRVWLSDTPLLWLGVHYGVTDALTSSVAGGRNKVTVGFKWNFYNNNTWSLGAGTWAGYQFRKANDYWDMSKQMPIGASLIASRVIDHRHKLHLAAELARNRGKESSDYNYYYSSSESRVLYGRVTGTYEIRLNRRHALSMWTAGELTNSQSTWSGGDELLGDSGYSTKDKALLFGAGYQYLREKFGGEIGLELGPKLVTQESIYHTSFSNESELYPYSYSWDSLTVGGSLTASINYRL